MMDKMEYMIISYKNICIRIKNEETTYKNNLKKYLDEWKTYKITLKGIK